MNSVSIILSVVAIVVSIGTVYIEGKRESKLAQMNIRSTNSSEIFDTFLIKTIPKARTLLRFDNMGKLKNGDELCGVLTEMLIAALFYKYADEPFYTELKNMCTELEDTLVSEADRKHLEQCEQDDLLCDIQSKMVKIYQLIDKKKVGEA